MVGRRLDGVRPPTLVQAPEGVQSFWGLPGERRQRASRHCRCFAHEKSGPHRVGDGAEWAGVCQYRLAKIPSTKTHH